MITALSGSNASFKSMPSTLTVSSMGFSECGVHPRQPFFLRSFRHQGIGRRRSISNASRRARSTHPRSNPTSQRGRDGQSHAGNPASERVPGRRDGPIPFQKKNTTLWLPKRAEIYFDFRKHLYYRRQSFDHYMLYSVDSDEKRKEPATTSVSQTTDGDNKS